MSQAHNVLKSIVIGGKDAFRQFYELFSEKVFNTAINYVQNETDAEEITQDVFISILRNANKICFFKLVEDHRRIKGFDQKKY